MPTASVLRPTPAATPQPRGMKTGHHSFSTEDTKLNFSVGASRSIDHVILLRQWGLQQAPEVQDLSKMLFFDRAVDSGRKLGPLTALLGQNAVREIPAEASLPRSPPEEFSDHASRFGQTSWGKIVGAANGANFPSRGSQSYMFVESSLFGNSIATKRPPPRHVRGRCAHGPSRNVPSIPTVILDRNPVNGVEIAKEREDGRSRLGQPGINAGPTTG
jgi:hypothetical protein